jgi:replicative DNA helicase
MEKASFSKYGKDFQEKLAKLILDDRGFCDQIEEVLDVNFFEVAYLQLFVKKIFLYKEKYSAHPSYSTVTMLMRSEIDDASDVLKKQVRDYFARILVDAEQPMSEAAYIKEVSLDFCKKQKLKEAILKSVELINSSSFDEVSSLITEAIKLGQDNNVGYDYMFDFEERFLFKARNPVTTGWDEIDKICKGGLGKGELGVVIAPTGAGKSMALVHLGAEALKDGKNVVHYTLELQDTVVASRYDSCVTSVPLSDLGSFKEEIYEKIKDIDGRLIVKEYPTKSVSTKALRNHIEKLKNRNIKIDMIIVDYADLLRPVTVRNEKRIELESIYEELRSLAQEFECTIWTASQTNRSGLNAEVITMESISEAFNKCFVADFIFSISRTIEDKNVNGGRIFIAKNRNGPDGVIYPIFMDTSNVKIKVLTQTTNVMDIIKKTDEDRIKDLKEKYKKHKMNTRRSTTNG